MAKAWSFTLWSTAMELRQPKSTRSEAAHGLTGQGRRRRACKHTVTAKSVPQRTDRIRLATVSATLPLVQAVRMTRPTTGTGAVGKACLCLVLAFIGCQGTPDQDVTSKTPYAEVVGERYRVVADGLYAYGVFESLNNRTVSFVDLVPLRIGGPEIAFEQEIPKGQVIRIVSARQRHTAFGRRTYYVVALESSPLRVDVPVHLELSRGNEGVGAELNPALFRRVKAGE
jgi:hypothetical protein